MEVRWIEKGINGCPDSGIKHKAKIIDINEDNDLIITDKGEIDYNMISIKLEKKNNIT